MKQKLPKALKIVNKLLNAGGKQNVSFVKRKTTYPIKKPNTLLKCDWKLETLWHYSSSVRSNQIHRKPTICSGYNQTWIITKKVYWCLEKNSNNTITKHSFWKGNRGNLNPKRNNNQEMKENKKLMQTLHWDFQIYFV